MEAYLANIKAKTGKTPEDFRALAEGKNFAKHSEVIAWLKSEFGLGHGHANLIAHLILHAGEPAVTPEDAVAQHFTGNKAAWREAYDRLLENLMAFGPDVSVSSGKTYISLLRKDKKFGIVQVTGKRMDIGIKLGGTPAKDRFEESGSWNAMVTHRVRIEDVVQLDEEVLNWLHQAYDKA